MTTQRLAVNSLFGLYDVAANTNDITLTAPDAPMYDYILRGKDGIQNKILHSDRTLEALMEPVTHLDKIRNNLEAIAIDLADEFPKIFSRQLNRGITLKEARENTKKEIDIKYDKLMKQHNEDFPKELTHRIAKKLTGDK